MILTIVAKFSIFLLQWKRPLPISPFRSRRIWFIIRPNLILCVWNTSNYVLRLGYIVVQVWTTLWGRAIKGSTISESGQTLFRVHTYFFSKSFSGSNWFRVSSDWWRSSLWIIFCCCAVRTHTVSGSELILLVSEMAFSWLKEENLIWSQGLYICQEMLYKRVLTSNSFLQGVQNKLPCIDLQGCHTRYGNSENVVVMNEPATLHG